LVAGPAREINFVVEKKQQIPSEIEGVVTITSDMAGKGGAHIRLTLQQTVREKSSSSFAMVKHVKSCILSELYMIIMRLFDTGDS
jgi:hypothetical protein